MVAPVGNFYSALSVLRPNRDSTGIVTVSSAPAAASGGNMPQRPSRRDLLAAAPLAALAGITGSAAASPAGDEVVTADFPAHERDVVKEVVGKSHGDYERVKGLVEARPALAKAVYDWGYGDWESALGAASHVGRRDIAELLIAHGARPDLFTAAMMGWVDAVRTAIAASPGIQRQTGPHGITLLAHARAGGQAAVAAVAFLESLGDADPRPQVRELTDAQRDAYPGSYAFGPGATDRLVVDVGKRGELGVARAGRDRRPLFHLGEHTFHPAGAPAVRIRFEAEGPRVTALTIVDGGVRVRALRVA